MLIYFRKRSKTTIKKLNNKKERTIFLQRPSFLMLNTLRNEKQNKN